MTPQQQLTAVGLLALAMILGGAIGYERAYAAKAAGVRTNALVAGAAALVVLLGEALLGGAGAGDSTRALHAVVTGIGFLGAGTIVKGDDGQAGGLTTAATIFTVAAIGGATGAGYPILATGGAVLVLVVLRGLHRLDPSIRAASDASANDTSANDALAESTPEVASRR